MTVKFGYFYSPTAEVSNVFQIIWKDSLRLSWHPFYYHLVWRPLFHRISDWQTNWIKGYVTSRRTSTIRWVTQISASHRGLSWAAPPSRSLCEWRHELERPQHVMLLFCESSCYVGGLQPPLLNPSAQHFNLDKVRLHFRVVVLELFLKWHKRSNVCFIKSLEPLFIW